jgi:hypothetical protein
MATSTPSSADFCGHCRKSASMIFLRNRSCARTPGRRGVFLGFANSVRFWSARAIAPLWIVCAGERFALTALCEQIQSGRAAAVHDACRVHDSASNPRKLYACLVAFRIRTCMQNMIRDWRYGARMLVAAVTACWIPARRAARVEPIVALRHE